MATTLSCQREQVIEVSCGEGRLTIRCLDHGLEIAAAGAKEVVVPGLAILKFMRDLPHEVGLGIIGRRRRVVGVLQEDLVEAGPQVKQSPGRIRGGPAENLGVEWLTVDFTQTIVDARIGYLRHVMPDIGELTGRKKDI